MKRRWQVSQRMSAGDIACFSFMCSRNAFIPCISSPHCSQCFFKILFFSTFSTGCFSLMCIFSAFFPSTISSHFSHFLRRIRRTTVLSGLWCVSWCFFRSLLRLEAYGHSGQKKHGSVMCVFMCDRSSAFWRNAFAHISQKNGSLLEDERRCLCLTFSHVMTPLTFRRWCSRLCCLRSFRVRKKIVQRRHTKNWSLMAGACSGTEVGTRVSKWVETKKISLTKLRLFQSDALSSNFRYFLVDLDYVDDFDW